MDLATITIGSGNALPGINRRVVGDGNSEGRFDQFDLVQTLQANKYLSGEPAAWSEDFFIAQYNGAEPLAEIMIKTELMANGSVMFTATTATTVN